MRSSAQRLVAVYLAMLCLLAATRYATRNDPYERRALRDREDFLVYRRAQLHLDVQKLESSARVREWAAKNGFVSWSTAPTEYAPLPGLPAPPPAPRVSRPLEVVTLWR